MARRRKPSGKSQAANVSGRCGGVLTLLGTRRWDIASSTDGGRMASGLLGGEACHWTDRYCCEPERLPRMLVRLCTI